MKLRSRSVRPVGVVVALAAALVCGVVVGQPWRDVAFLAVVGVGLLVVARRLGWLRFGVFGVVATVTALALARIVGGPGAPDRCAGDECDANIGPALAFLFIGLPAGVAVGLLASRLVRRR
jgi:hypothetical protein